MSPSFLTVDEIQAIHRDQIARYGGTLGIRDLGLLESAVAMPSATFGGDFLHADIWSMAAAYLFHLVQNHPFVDGNKRVGAVAADVFLAFNGMRLIADPDTFAEMVLSVAQGAVQKPAIAAFFRENCQPL